MVRAAIDIPSESLNAFCRRWKVRELSLFGSVLRQDFRPDSDVDVLVDFEPNHGHSLFDVVEMEDELREILHRDVDLVFKGGLRNPIRGRRILANRQVIYAG